MTSAFRQPKAAMHMTATSRFAGWLVNWRSGPSSRRSSLAETSLDRIYVAEKSGAGIRAGVVILNAIVDFLLMDRSNHIIWLANVILVVSCCYATYVYLAQPYRRYRVLTVSYLTSVTDGLLITLWLLASGGLSSPFYLLWYVSIVGVALRYNYPQTMIAALIYALSYVTMLAALGQIVGHWPDVIIRVGYIFFISALAGEAAREAFDQRCAKLEVEQRIRAVEEAEAKFRAVAENAKDAIVSMDRHGNVVYFNKEAERVYGYSAGEILGDSVQVLIPEDSMAAYRSQLDRLLEGGRLNTPKPVELVGRRKDGTEVPLEVSLARWVTSEGAFVTGIARDITDRKRAEQALLQQALYDGLTGLPNRTLFHDRLKQGLAAAHRDRGQLAVLLMDLDFFKEVNDTFGHGYGDLLLKQVAERLRWALRESDTIARLGGDEFGILLAKVGAGADAVEIAGKLLRVLNDPFTIEGQAVHIQASTGIVLAPDQGDDPETLMRHADVAMYVAKNNREGYAVYSTEQDAHTAQRLSLIAGLRQAIQQDELVLHYQPKLRLRGSGTLEVEALVQWQQPNKGLLGPDQFIPVAERTGLIKPLTFWVLNRAVADCCRWLREGLDVCVAINLSMRNLSDPELPATVRQVLSRWGLAPSCLKVEVTESAIMANPARTMDVLTRLNATGIGISIDDFGTGYSSLAYLKRLPAQEVKIDKSFVVDMVANENDALIVRSTIDLAHNLGLEVVAEGVETKETCDRLLSLGCDVVQGYYLARPMRRELLAGWAASRGLVPAAANRSREGDVSGPRLGAANGNNREPLPLHRLAGGRLASPAQTDTTRLVDAQGPEDDAALAALDHERLAGGAG